MRTASLSLLTSKTKHLTFASEAALRRLVHFDTDDGATEKSATMRSLRSHGFAYWAAGRWSATNLGHKQQHLFETKPSRASR